MATTTQPIETTPGTGPTITCQECHQPIDDTHPGHLEVLHADVTAARQAVDQWHADNSRPLVNGAALLDYPEPAHWRAVHRDCDPDPDAGSYWIAHNRIDTWQRLIARTAHLMGKSWLDHTDWDELLADAAANGCIDTARKNR